MDFNSASSILNFLLNSGYLIIFFVMLIEGPMITYVAAFAASLGYFSIFWVFLLSILGNVLPDIAWYGAGRAGGKFVLKTLMRFFKVDTMRIDKIQKYLKNNVGKTISIIKITPIIPPVGLTATGVMKIPFSKFLFYSVLVSTIYSAFFTILGFYSGIAFNLIATYIQEGSLVISFAILVLTIGWFISKAISKIIYKEIEQI